MSKLRVYYYVYIHFNVYTCQNYVYITMYIYTLTYIHVKTTCTNKCVCQNMSLCWCVRTHLCACVCISVSDNGHKSWRACLIHSWDTVHSTFYLSDQLECVPSHRNVFCMRHDSFICEIQCAVSSICPTPVHRMCSVK